MKVLMSKIKKKHAIIALAFIFGFALLQIVPTVKAQADTGLNLYDTTYIDKLESELNGLIQSSNEEVKKQTATTVELKTQLDASLATQAEYEKKLIATEKELTALKESLVFQIIKLSAGKTLIGDASTEIIVRNKNRVVAYVEKTATGGVSNLISGKDIPNGVIIPDNQLLLVPKSDGRGITAKADADIMIKGTYTIK